ncbi:hypothetical protein ACLBWX_22485 [Methylobacterium sp. M6A4_1b]
MAENPTTGELYKAKAVTEEEIVADCEVSEHLRRAAVRTAILLARPEKP